MAAKPSYALLYANYPKQDDYTAVKKQIGGHVDADWIENTCAIRLSRAMNYSGFPIPGHRGGLSTVSGSDKKWYAFRMQDLKKYVATSFGPPSITALQSRSGAVDRTAFAGKKGIIAFDILFNDARGHLDLWDGQTFIHEHVAVLGGKNYFALATNVQLWEMS